MIKSSQKYVILSKTSEAPVIKCQIKIVTCSKRVRGCLRDCLIYALHRCLDNHGISVNFISKIFREKVYKTISQQFI